MNNKKPLIIFGMGSTASVLQYNILNEGAHKLAAFAVDKKFLANTEFMGYPAVPFEEVETHFPPDQFQMIIAVGYININHFRAERYQQAKEKGYRLGQYISKHTIVWDGLLCGDNCRIGHGSFLQPYTQIGNNVSIGSGCIIGHHTQIMDHAFIASGVTIAGGVTIEPYAVIGTGAVIRNKVRIGAESVVGSGAVILQDTDKKGVYMGTQATKLKINSDQMSLA